MTEKEKIQRLKNEIVMARSANTEELTPIIQENLQRYMGTFIPSFGPDWDIVLNEVYPIIQNWMPSIFFRNPRAFLKPKNKTYIGRKRDPVSGQMVDIEIDSAKSAKTQEDILNYAIEQIGFKKEERKVLLDALLFPYGVLWVGYKGDYGMTEEQSLIIKNDKVFVKRINPLRFIHDPMVNISNLDEARWAGRIIDMPLEELLEDDKLDVDKAQIKGFVGYGQLVGSATQLAAKGMGSQDYIRINAAKRALIEYADKGFKDSKSSHFVQLFEIYHRPSRKEARNGEKGKVYLLCDEQDKPLRVNDWNIKAEGFPSKILQFNELPDAMFGLSDIETYKQIADQKNVITNLQLRNVQENSKVWVALAKSGASEEDIEHIQKGDQSIIMFDGDTVQGKMLVSTPGGMASSEVYTAGESIDRQLQEKSGITDLRKGFLQSGEESATSVQIRNAGGAARPSYRQDMMSDHLKECFSYINGLNKQFMPYKDAVRIIGSMDLEWSENPTKEEIQADVDVEIDVYSMLPENPDKEMQELQLVLNLMVQSLTTPQIMQKIQQEGNTFNISPVIEQMLFRLKLRDPDIYRNIKPEESLGYASVSELYSARDNVNAALQGNPQIPSPPAVGQDHRARLSVYTEIQNVLQAIPEVQKTPAYQMLMQLIQIQMSIAQQEEQKQANKGKPVKLQKPVGV